MSYVCVTCLRILLGLHFACMELRVSFVFFHLSKCYIDYVYVYNYILLIIYVMYSIKQINKYVQKC